MPFKFNPFTNKLDITGTSQDILTTKGDLLTRNSTTLARLPVGSDGQVLVANSAQPEGLAWSTAAGGGDVSSNTAISVDSEVALFSGVSGKLIKRASSTGIAKLASGVLSTVTAPSGAIVGDTDTQTLQNKTIDNTNTLNVQDTLFTILDNGDPTKKAQFNTSAITSGVTRAKSLQDISGTLYETGGQDVSVDDGGTGQSSYTDGQLLIGNSVGNTLTKATLTAGTGITIVNGNGSIEISSLAAGSFVLKAGDTMTGTLNIFPSNDSSALILKEFTAQPTSKIFQIQNSAGTFKIGCNTTNLYSTMEGFTMEFDTTSITNPTIRRVGLALTLNAGYTGSGFTTALSFTNNTQGTSNTWIADVSTGFGYRPNGNRGIFGGAIGDTTGVNLGGLGAAGKGSINIGLMGTSTTNKTGAVNIGVFGTGLQLSGGTGAASIGGYFTLYNTATAPPNTISAALIADNQTFASPIFLARDNGTEVLRIFDTGQFTFTSVSPGSNITASTEKIQLDVNLSATKTWNTGALTLQREFVIRAPTYAFAAASTLSTAATFAITGAPIAGTNATITNPYALFVQSGTSQFDGDISLSSSFRLYFGGTTAAIKGSSTEIVLNDLGNDVDFTIESTTNSSLFHTDAGSNFVSIGTNAQGLTGAILNIAGGLVSQRGTDLTTSSHYIERYSNNTFAANRFFRKSRGASLGTQTIVQSGDALGVDRYFGSDGSTFVEAAQIAAVVDGTPGATSMPGRLVFFVTPSGSGTPVEALRIKSNKNIQVSDGVALQTGQTAGDTLLLQAYDVDGAAYTTFGTLRANNTPTFDLSASTTVGGNTIADILSAQTFTNKRITPRASTVVSNATPTINTDNVDFFAITALSENITSMTTNLSGTPTQGQKLMIRFKDDGTSRSITWGASFQASADLALPTATTASKTLYTGFVWHSSAGVWQLLAVLDNFS